MSQKSMTKIRSQNQPGTFDANGSTVHVIGTCADREAVGHAVKMEPKKIVNKTKTTKITQKNPTSATC
jgi:hypothetical protein